MVNLSFEVHRNINCCEDVMSHEQSFSLFSVIPLPSEKNMSASCKRKQCFLS